MIENIDKYKFVILTGCSYGVIFRELFSKIPSDGENNLPKNFKSSENVIVINVASQSM